MGSDEPCSVVGTSRTITAAKTGPIPWRPPLAGVDERSVARVSGIDQIQHLWALPPCRSLRRVVLPARADFDGERLPRSTSDRNRSRPGIQMVPSARPTTSTSPSRARSLPVLDRSVLRPDRRLLARGAREELGARGVASRMAGELAGNRAGPVTTH